MQSSHGKKCDSKFNKLLSHKRKVRNFRVASMVSVALLVLVIMLTAVSSIE